MKYNGTREEYARRKKSTGKNEPSELSTKNPAGSKLGK